MVVVPDDVSRPVRQRGELVVVALGVHEEGPVLTPSNHQQSEHHPAKEETHHKKQIHIIQPEILQALVQPRLDARVVRRPHLGHDKQVLALDVARRQRLPDALADLVLVAVAVGAVDEAVAGADRVRDGRLDLARRGLPCPWGVWCERDASTVMGEGKKGGGGGYRSPGWGWTGRC